MVRQVVIVIIVILFLMPMVAVADHWVLQNRWHFDGDDLLKDSISTGVNLSQFGAPVQISGYSGDAVYMNPTSTYQEGFGAHIDAVDLNVNGIRIEAMIRPDSTHDGYLDADVIVSRGGHFGLYFIADGNGTPTTLRWEIRGLSNGSPVVSQVDYTGSVAALLDGQWHKVVALYDPNSDQDPNIGQMELQVDNGVTDSGVFSGTVGTTPNSWIFVGTGLSGTTGVGVGFSGAIDEVAICTLQEDPIRKWASRNMWHFDGDNVTEWLRDDGPYQACLTEVSGPGTVEQIPGYSGNAIYVDSRSNPAYQEGMGLLMTSLDLNATGLKVTAMIRPDSQHHGDWENDIICARGGHFNLFFLADEAGTPYMLWWEIRGVAVPAGGGRPTAFFDYLVYSGRVVDLLDGNWHKVMASYDPFSHRVEMQVDDGLIDGKVIMPGATGIQVGQVPNPWFMIGTGLAGTTRETCCGAGFSGAIDEVSTEILVGEVDLTMQANPSGKSNTTPAAGVTKVVKGFATELVAEPYIECPDIYTFDHWEGDVIDPDKASTVIFMDQNKTVTAVYTLAEKVCGDACHAYPNGDIVLDCQINMLDLNKLCEEWLICRRPVCD